MMSAAVAGTTFRPTPSYTTLRDVTPDSAISVPPEQKETNHGPRRDAFPARALPRTLVCTVRCTEKDFLRTHTSETDGVCENAPQFLLPGAHTSVLADEADKNGRILAAESGHAPRTAAHQSKCGAHLCDPIIAQSATGRRQSSSATTQHGSQATADAA